MRVAVLGAGHGGQAMAADLTLAGHEVRLAAVPEHAGKIAILKAIGGIHLEGTTSTGVPAGFARIALITDDVPQAIAGAAVIMLVLPAFAQKPYMEILRRWAERGQLVVFNPGKFAALEFTRMLIEAGRYGEILVGETETLIYAARIQAAGHNRIMGIKNMTYYAAMPAVQTARTLRVLDDLLPRFAPARNVLQTSVDDMAMTIHPITTLMNASRIEQLGPYLTHHYDITPALGRVILAVDGERYAIAQRLRYETLSFFENYERYYGVSGKSVDELILNVAAYGSMSSPDKLTHRYVTEEVPYGLVAVEAMGRVVGVPTPGMSAIIELANMANDVDYRAGGRRFEAMGLAGFDLEGLIDYVTYGPRT
jgi:opine dehydrogenase